jgi:adenylate cyclase
MDSALSSQRLCSQSCFYVCFFGASFLVGADMAMQSYYIMGTALVLFFGTERSFLSSSFGVIAAASIIALSFHESYNVGPQFATVPSGKLIATVFAACAILLPIVFLVLFRCVRPEAVAAREYEISECLLANILPAGVAARLKGRAEVAIADKYDVASILFADMVGFTARTSDMAPEDLVRFLHRVFTAFDRLVERHGLEKIKTMGDSYMVVSGVPAPRPDHTQALAQLALGMRAAAADLQDPHGRSVPIRIVSPAVRWWLAFSARGNCSTTYGVMP